jgi:hypothetical protein
MSYMKSRQANHWAAREFKYEAASRDGRLRFLNWVDFEDEFCKDFLPLNAEATAVNVLEMSAYFQGKWMVDDYLDHFQDLVYDSGYTNPKTIVVKFHQELDQRISTALAGMASGRPSDTDPEAWFNLAVQMDQNHTANEALQASHCTTSTPTPVACSYASVLRPPLPAQFAHSSPSLGNCKGNCRPVSLRAEMSKSGRGSEVSLLISRHRY